MAIGQIDPVQARLAALEAKIEELEAARDHPPAAPDPDPERAVTRRRLMGMAGAAAAGAVGATVLAATPAGAIDGGNVVIGASNSGTLSTALDTAIATTTFQASNGGTGAALRGFSGGPGGTGVRASATGAFGIGLTAESTDPSGSYPLSIEHPVNDRSAHMRLRPHNNITGPPTTVNGHVLGEFWVDHEGVLFQCMVEGSPGMWVRQSSLVTLASPFRIYDSRSGQPNPSGATQGPLAFGGAARLVDCTNTPNPAGSELPNSSSAILFNVTLASTVGAVGSVVVWADGASEPTTASITWTGSGVVVGNAVTSSCPPGQRIQMKCTTGSSTHVILDVIGFYV